MKSSFGIVGNALLTAAAISFRRQPSMMKDGLLTGSLLEDTRELARRERRRDRIRARLQRVLTARVVQDVRKRERVADETLALEATRDRARGLAAGDDEAPRFGARVLCEIGFRPDAIRDQTADEVLLEKRVV